MMRSMIPCLAFAAMLIACGSDDTTGTGGAAPGGGGAGATGGGGAGAAGGGGSGGGLGDVTCGSETCTGGDVCITRPQPPACEPKLDTADPCPPDMPNDTFCGGAGTPCCCADPPDPIYECDPGAMCAGEVTCDCLTDACPVPNICSSTGTEGVFVCEDPPAA